MSYELTKLKLNRNRYKVSLKYTLVHYDFYIFLKPCSIHCTNIYFIHKERGQKQKVNANKMKGSHAQSICACHQSYHISSKVNCNLTCMLKMGTKT